MQCDDCQKTFPKKYFKLHIRFEHRTSVSRMKFSCNFKDCNRCFSNYKFLLQHRKRCKHFETIVTESDIPKHVNNNDTTLQLNLCNDKQQFDCNPNDTNDTDVYKTWNIEDTRYELREFALQLVSSLHADATLSRVQIDRITHIFHSFLNSNYMNDIKSGIALIESPDSGHILEQFKLLQDVFVDIDSEYKRNKLLTSIGYYIEPIKIFFGTMEIRNDNGLKTQNIYRQLIPLRKVLKIYFEVGDIFQKTCEYIATLNENNEIFNIIQTEFWKSKILNVSKEKSFIFPLFLYEDAFETANPLGSHAGIYKLSGMYISIPCLPPELCSRLDSIFLAQLYHADDAKLFPKEQIYSYLVKELMFLEKEGITLVLNSENIQIYFKLTLIIGDNLGLHGILGFVESFSADVCCRFCTVSKNVSCKLCTEDISILHNKDNYAENITRNNSSSTGIKDKCAFNVLNSFHVVENYSVDIMHDLLEGVCGYEMNYVFNSIIL